MRNQTILEYKTINMKISTIELAKYLNEYIDPLKIEENTYNGIQVANSGTITKIATAVSASLEVIEKTAELKAQALIVHHGIFLKNESPVLTETKYKKIKTLIDNDIALLCYHLPLDAHRELGNNWKAAKDLGLSDLQPFVEYNNHMIGVRGSMQSLSFDEFKKKVESYYGNKATAVKVKDTIKSVAIVSGGADRFVVDAAKTGADCYITGRVDEPVWDAAREENICFLGLGHYSTETVGVKALAEHLQQKFNIECAFIDTKNPF